VKAGFMGLQETQKLIQRRHRLMTKLFFPSRQDSEPPMSSTGAKAEQPGRAFWPTNFRQCFSASGTILEHVLSRCL